LTILHTGDPRLSGSRYHAIVLDATFCSCEFRASPQTEVPPLAKVIITPILTITQKRCEIEHKLVLFTNGLLIGTEIGDLE